MNDNFDDYAISIESDVLSNDFDNIDLYGNKLEEQETDGYGDDIQYE